MKKAFLDSDITRMITALTVVGMASGLLLVFVYTYAMPKIKINMSRDTERAIENIFPDLKEMTKTDDEGVYRITGKDGTLTGYAFIASGNGYQGEIKLVAGTDPALSAMKGMEVLESQETPGLGAEIAGKDFRGQFSGLSLAEPIEYVKNEKPDKPNEIEAITGATISSRAVVRILNDKIAEMRKKLQ